VRRLAALALLAGLTVPASATARDFPKGFLWGPAISGFQTEAGGRPANADRHSGWWVWSHDRENIDQGRVSGDLVERGPGHWRLFRRDADLARRRLGANAFRLSIEWSRIFPRPTYGATGPRQLDRLANPAAVRQYAAELRAIRRRGMEPMVTLNRFTLPTWIHDPIGVRDALAGGSPDDSLRVALSRAGWLFPSTSMEFGKFAAWAAWRYGRLVDFWVTINEPMVVATSGYLNVPGAVAPNREQRTSGGWQATDRYPTSTVPRLLPAARERPAGGQPSVARSIRRRPPTVRPPPRPLAARASSPSAS
jgi:beta-galactosidase